MKTSVPEASVRWISNAALEIDDKKIGALVGEETAPEYLARIFHSVLGFTDNRYRLVRAAGKGGSALTTARQNSRR